MLKPISGINNTKKKILPSGYTKLEPIKGNTSSINVIKPDINKKNKI